MITRPLDLASKLRPEPRNFDFLFYVNGGLLVMFFLLFGSRFVLAPGVGVDFQLPEARGARVGAAPTTHRIMVKSSGLIFTDDGPTDPPGLRDWLAEQAEQAKKKKILSPSLLIIANKQVSHGTITEIENAAYAAGFKVQVAAEEPKAEAH